MSIFSSFIWSFKRFFNSVPSGLVIDDNLSYKENILAIAYRDFKPLYILGINIALFILGIALMEVFDYLISLYNIIALTNVLTIIAYSLIIVGLDIYRLKGRDNILKLFYLIINIALRGKLLIVYLFLIIYENLVGIRERREKNAL